MDELHPLTYVDSKHINYKHRNRLVAEYEIMRHLGYSDAELRVVHQVGADPDDAQIVPETVPWLD